MGYFREKESYPILRKIGETLNIKTFGLVKTSIFWLM